MPQPVVDRAALLARAGAAPAQAISRALVEHGHRYAHPADYVRAVLELAAALRAAAEHPRPESPRPVAAPLPPRIERPIRPPPGSVAPAVARVLDRPTQAGQRSSAPPSVRCAEPACRHGRATHLRRGFAGHADEPCTWSDCPCENFQVPGAPRTAHPAGGWVSARIVRAGEDPAVPAVQLARPERER